ncbi:hypothetical protein BJI48_08390 [Helicobacter sp. 11S02596-1]|nr:hypothetical protein BJI48_08390 [Helicobacter sp. 11S02596-1]
MKESWELVRLFEDERERFKQEILSYQEEISQAKAKLKKIRQQVEESKNEVQKLEETKQEKIDEIKDIKRHLFEQKIKKNISKLKNEKLQIINEKKEEILPKPLELIEIYLKDGTVAKARPVKRVFTDGLYKKYRVILKENKILKEQILELELENSKLKIELRDFYAEDMLKANQSLDHKTEEK